MYNGRSYGSRFEHSSRGQAKPVLERLAQVVPGQMGSRNSISRVLDSVLKDTAIQRRKAYSIVRSVRRGTSRRSRFFAFQRGYRVCHTPVQRRVLLNLFSCPQENGGSKTYLEPKTNQWVDSKSNLQNGNFTVGSQGCVPGRLDRFSRSEGRILSCSDPSRPQEVSQVLYSGQVFPIQGSPLRVNNISKGVYKDSDPHNGSPQTPRSQGVSLSGRYFVHRGVQTSGGSPLKAGDFCVNSGRIHDQCQEVQSHSSTGHGVPRSQDPDRYGSGSPADGKGSQLAGSGTNFQRKGKCDSQEVVSFARSNGFSPPNDIGGSTPHEVRSVALPSPMEQKETSNELQNSGLQKSVPPPTMVDKHRESPIRFAPVPARTSTCSHNRCLLTRLGRRTSAGRGETGGEHVDDPGSVELGGIVVAHQPSGIVSSVPVIETFRESSGGKEDPCEVRQYHHMCLHKQDGRHEVSDPLQEGNGSMVLVSGEKDLVGSSPCPRSGQHDCGFPVSPGSGQQGVVHSQPCSVHHIQDMGNSSSRPVCVCTQPQAQDLLLHVPGSQCSRERRLLDQLERLLSGIRIPANSIDAQGGPEDQEGESQGSNTGPEVAGPILVSDAIGDANGSTDSVTSKAGSVDSVQGSAPGSPAPQIGGLESKRRHLRSKGFQEEVIDTMEAARAVSTKACYKARWEAFSCWCNSRDQDPFKTDNAVIASFLQDLFDRGRAWSTIRGYVAAISACHPSFQEKSLGSVAEIRDFIGGVFKLRPPVKSIIPRWDLGIVLHALAMGPFEPLSEASLQCLTYKTAFLVAITSAARVSELQALDSRPELSRLHRHKATLRLNPAFMPKVPNPTYLDREIELEAFYPNPKDHLEKALHKLCPVRALRFYLQRTEALRQDPQLFVSYQTGGEGKKVSKSTISRWIKQTIMFSYRHLGRDLPISSVRAHSTRAVASSLADVRGVSPAELCAAATWSSSMTFARHYRLDMAASRSISSQVLHAAVAHRS